MIHLTLLILTTAFIILSHYLLTIKIGLNSLTDKTISIIILTSGQIILTELILGVFGFLFLSSLMICNLLISFTILYLSRQKRGETVAKIRDDISTLALSTQLIYSSPYNLFLSLLASFTMLWFILASILLPPRGVDDLTYHLTVIYEYIIHHKIFLLPMEYRTIFAFPLNAELLFMWPTIFLHNDILIGLVQVIFALLGIIVVYALARMLSLSKETSFFTGLLFFFTPAVLTQAGSGYIDIIVNIFFLIGLYFALKFYQKGRVIFLYLAAITIGLLVGMKYTAVLLTIPLQIFIVSTLIKQKLLMKYIWRYLLIIIISGGFWYIRNLIIFHNPIMPTNIFNKGMGLFIVNEYENSLNIFVTVMRKLESLYFYDIGLGSFHGGYGITFWGIGFPCWIYLFIQSIGKKDRTLFSFFIWVQLVLGFSILFLVPLDQLYLCPRYTLFIVAIGILAIGKMLEFFQESFIYRLVICTACCLFSLLATFPLASSTLPSYAVDIPINDMLNRKEFSRMRYLRLSSYMTPMSYAWETLDFITKDYPAGLDCYFASNFIDYTSPIYGSKLQNRIWNFSSQTNQPPDVLLFHILENQDVHYVKKKITLKNVLQDPDYILVDKTGGAYLFLHKKILDQPVILSALKKHYENYPERKLNDPTR